MSGVSAAPVHETVTELTILSGGKTTPIDRARLAGDDVWLTPADLAAATGWELKPEGLCRDDVCVPLPTGPDSPSAAGSVGAVVRQVEGQPWIDVTGFARYAGQPYAADARHRVWSFGPPAHEWRARAGSTQAPAFTLPDFSGKLHSLADYRGKKVFLVTWASW